MENDNDIKFSRVVFISVSHRTNFTRKQFSHRSQLETIFLIDKQYFSVSCKKHENSITQTFLPPFRDVIDLISASNRQEIS